MNYVMSEARTNLASTTRLAPETIRIRDALIEKFSDKPIEELNSFIARALDTETDEFKRLGLLAARVYILRQRVLGLKAFIRDDTMETLPEIDLTLPSQDLSDTDVDVENDLLDEEAGIENWYSLRMIEPGEVNGVRFFKGTIINARPEDADRLIASGKAIVVDEDGNPIDDDTSTGLETGEYSSGTTDEQSDEAPDEQPDDAPDEQPDDAPDEQPNEDKGTSPEEMETEK
ncbi:hypothetical protein OAH90_02100 [Alphaproteobacteria bacterium]|nr:hypothetical protein [Alphaproteobacteria bacterium]